MKVTIIPHSSDRVKEINIHNGWIIFLLLFLLISISIRYIFKYKFLSPEELKEKNKKIEEMVKNYVKKYEKIKNNVQEFYAQIIENKSVKSMVDENFEKDVKNIGQIKEEIEKLNKIIDKIYEKLEENDDYAKNIPSIAPVNGFIIQTFGKGYDIFTGKEKHVIGVNFSAHYDSEIYATADGKVEYIGNDKYSGLKIIINHNNGFKTLYSHLSIVKVKIGQFVKRGQTIGLIGTSGKTVGYKLHYEVWKNDKPVNPIDFILHQINI